jgi:hypothetical protein
LDWGEIELKFPSIVRGTSTLTGLRPCRYSAPGCDIQPEGFNSIAFFRTTYWLAQNLTRRFSHRVLHHIRDEKFSTTPSSPAQNFSGRVWLIGSGNHAGENDLLLDNHPTVG